MKEFFKNEKVIKLRFFIFHMESNVLAGLLDEKLTRVISLFLKNPEKRFYLSEIARQSDVNTATTFRILNKIVKEGIVKATVIGKARTYQLTKGERVQSLSRMLKRDDSDALEVFREKLEAFPRVRLILVDSKTTHEAKLIIVDDFTLKDRVERVANEIYESYRFKITFVEINPQQYKDMKAIGMIGEKKVLFRRSTSK
jgi:DNA-binding MarR family transcriptional regulator